MVSVFASNTAECSENPQPADTDLKLQATWTQHKPLITRPRLCRQYMTLKNIIT